MNSPFPGMDPYLEQFWGDVHQSLVTYARDVIQPQLPRELVARAEERVFLHVENEDRRVVSPDVHVVEYPPQPAGSVAVATAVEVAEGLDVRVADEPMTEGFIEIIDLKSGNRVVTMIEFVSPTNKMAGEGNDKYREKQREARAGGVNSVEIDLTRQGRRDFVLWMNAIPAPYRTTYQACVRRAWKRNVITVFPVPLRERLPVIPIPLRQTDREVTLDLQALIDQCYRNGRYELVNYQSDPVPPLGADDATWADALLKTAGRR